MKLKEAVQAATAAINKKRQVKSEKVYVSYIDDNITVRALTTKEASDILEATAGDDELYLKKLIYASSDDLRKLGVELAKAGVIAEYHDVVDMFSVKDQSELIDLLTRLAGTNTLGITIGGKAGAEAIKN